MEKILVVEENEVQILWAEKTLSDYTTTVVRSVEEAQVVMEKGSFDIILCDLELPFSSQSHNVSWYNGYCFFEGNIIPLLETGKIKGASLISNFEQPLSLFQRR